MFSVSSRILTKSGFDIILEDKQNKPQVPQKLCEMRHKTKSKKKVPLTILYGALNPPPRSKRG